MPPEIEVLMSVCGIQDNAHMHIFCGHINEQKLLDSVHGLVNTRTQAAEKQSLVCGAVEADLLCACAHN